MTNMDVIDKKINLYRNEANKKYFETIQYYHQKSIIKIILSLSLPYIFILLTLWQYFFFDNELKYFFSFVIFLLSQRLLNTIVHDCAHQFISKDKAKNDLLCNLFFASLIGTNVEKYRNIHLAHHKYNGSSSDPEYINIENIKNSTEFFKFCMRYIFLFESIKLIKKYYFKKNLIYSNNKISKKILFLILDLKYVIFAQILLLIIFKIIDIKLYIIWIYISLTFSPLFSKLRFMIEHPGQDSLTVSTTGFFSDILFFAPFNFNYHFEHHAWPNLPPYNLKKLHYFLLKNQFFNNKKLLLNEHGYSKKIFKYLYDRV